MKKRMFAILMAGLMLVTTLATVCVNSESIQKSSSVVESLDDTIILTVHCFKDLNGNGTQEPETEHDAGGAYIAIYKDWNPYEDPIQTGYANNQGVKEFEIPPDDGYSVYAMIEEGIIDVKYSGGRFFPEGLYENTSVDVPLIDNFPYGLIDVVVKRINENPVVDAKVICERTDVDENDENYFYEDSLTNSEGECGFYPLPAPGTYKITVTKNGYEDSKVRTLDGTWLKHWKTVTFTIGNRAKDLKMLNPFLTKIIETFPPLLQRLITRL
jgi:hypothetical protein